MTDYSPRYLMLANRTRRVLLEALRTGPKTVAELARRVPVSRPAVSQHLKLLTESGLTVAEWDGNYHRYHLNTRSLVELRDDLGALWGDALAAFARHVGEENSPRAPRRRP